MLEKKTEYRLFPKSTFIGDIYLQFKHGDTWRFVPSEMEAYILKLYLTEEECPTSLPLFQEGRFMSCFVDQERYELIPFTKQYPNIERYFELLRMEHDEYVLKQKKARELKIRNL